MVVGLAARTAPGHPRASGRSRTVDRLYALPPELFAAERRAAIALAVAAGDEAAVAELAPLRRPTVAAWMVNLLALRRPDLVDDLCMLAADLRDAQRHLRGAELRELAVLRRRLLTAMAATARRLAVEAGRSAGSAFPMGEVEATLAAALADPDVAETVRSGRLTRATSYCGFGEIPRPRLRLVEATAEPAS